MCPELSQQVVTYPRFVLTTCHSASTPPRGARCRHMSCHMNQKCVLQSNLHAISTKVTTGEAVCQGLPDAGVWLAVEALGSVDGATAIGWGAHMFALPVGQLAVCPRRIAGSVTTRQHDLPYFVRQLRVRWYGEGGKRETCARATDNGQFGANRRGETKREGANSRTGMRTDLTVSGNLTARGCPRRTLLSHKCMEHKS